MIEPDDVAELRRLVDGLRSDLEVFTFGSTWRPRPFHPVLSRAIDAALVLDERLADLARDGRAA